MEPGLPALTPSCWPVRISEVPTFCRHNRLLANCTICAREQNFEVRPVISSSAARSTQPRVRAQRPALQPAGRPRPAARQAVGAGPAARTGTLRVRRLARGAEDGYSSPLVPGLRSSEDAARLASEIGFAAARLALMARVAAGERAAGAPEAWCELARAGELNARTELAVEHVLSGPRGIGSEALRQAALAAVRAWGLRQGSLAVGLAGDGAWAPERRFERDFERLCTLRAFTRDISFELLTLLGGLGLYRLAAGQLFLSGENEVTWAAKRVFGIGERQLLERRALGLAQACEVPLAALDLALHDWGTGERAAVQAQADSDAMPLLERKALHALGLTGPPS